MIVELTIKEISTAAREGLERRIGAMQARRCEPDGQPKADLWGNDIESCFAEFAVSKALNIHWHVTEDFSRLPGDCGGVEVRMTHHKHGRLIIKPRDPDNRPFVLARGRGQRWELAGWTLARDGKQQKYKDDPDGRFASDEQKCFFVPARDLEPVEELLRRRVPLRLVRDT